VSSTLTSSASNRHANDHAQRERPCECNRVVAVYFTMQDGRLTRLDKNAGSSIKAEDLVELACYSAKRSERVEVGCDTQRLTASEPHSRTDL
jgi:hypothetical protein